MAKQISVRQRKALFLPKSTKNLDLCDVEISIPKSTRDKKRAANGNNDKPTVDNTIQHARVLNEDSSKDEQKNQEGESRRSEDGRHSKAVDEKEKDADALSPFLENQIELQMELLNRQRNMLKTVIEDHKTSDPKQSLRQRLKGLGVKKMGELIESARKERPKEDNLNEVLERFNRGDRHFRPFNLNNANHY